MGKGSYGQGVMLAGPTRHRFEWAGATSRRNVDDVDRGVMWTGVMWTGVVGKEHMGGSD